MNTLGIRKHNRNRTGTVIIFPAWYLLRSNQEVDLRVGSTLTVGVGGLATDGFGRGEHIGIRVVTVDNMAAVRRLFSFAVVRQLPFHISIQIKSIHTFFQQHILEEIRCITWLPRKHTSRYFPIRLPPYCLSEDWELEAGSYSGTRTTEALAQYAASYGYWS